MLYGNIYYWKETSIYVYQYTVYDLKKLSEK